MRFKLDENFGARSQRLFHDAGHDVKTVRDESLQGADDRLIYRVCCEEQRCLVTLDLDFADVVRFPPAATAGIAVIRVPRNPSLALLERLVAQPLTAAGSLQIDGSLWIVEVDRLRIHQHGFEG